MYNNFSSKKTKKVISALLASALVVTSAPINADAATSTTKVLGVSKTFTVKKTTKVTNLSKAEKKIVKVTVNKKKKTVTVKGLKAGKVTCKIGSKNYTIKVGATKIEKKSFKTSVTAGKSIKVSAKATAGKGDKYTWKSSKKSVATVDTKKTGLTNTIKGVAAGTTTITVTSKNTGKKLSVKVTVKAADTETPAVSITPEVTTTPEATTGAATTAPDVTATPDATTGAATTAPEVTATPEATTGTATTAPVASATPEVTTAPAIVVASASAVSAAAVNVKTIAVTFNRELTKDEQDAVKASVTREKATQSIKSAFKDAKTLYITRDTDLAFVAATYSVELTGAVAYTADVKVEAQKATELKINSLVLEDGKAKAPVKISLKDQYGEEMPLVAGDFTTKNFVNTSNSSDNVKGELSFAEGAFYIDTASNAGHYKTDDLVSVVLLHKSGLTATATLKVVESTYVNEISLGAYELPTGTTRLTEDVKGVLVPYTAKNNYNEEVTLDASDYSIVSTDTSVLNTANIELYKDANNKTYFKIASFEAAGKTTVIVMNNKNGQTAKIDLDVQEKAGKPYAIQLETSSIEVAKGSEAYVAVTVTDKYGDKVAAKDLAGALVMASSNTDALDNGNITFIIDENDDNYGKLKIDASTAREDSTVIVTVSLPNGKNETVQVKIGKEAVPTTVQATIEDATLIAGGKTTIKTTVKDQYSSSVKYSDLSGKNCSLKATVTEGKDVVYNTDGEISTVEGTFAVTALKAGTAKIKVDLMKDTTVVDTKTVTVTVEANTEANLTYTVKEIPTLYKNGASITMSELTGTYAKEVVVTAKTAAGKTITIPADKILSVTSDSDKVVAEKVAVEEIDTWFVAGKAAELDKDVTAKLTIVVATDEGSVILYQNATVSKEAKKTVAIKLYDKVNTADDKKAITAVEVEKYGETIAFNAEEKPYIYTVDQFGVEEAMNAADAVSLSSFDKITGFSGDSATYSEKSLSFDDAGSDTKAESNSSFKVTLVTDGVPFTFTVKVTKDNIAPTAKSISVARKDSQETTDADVYKTGDKITITFSEAVKVENLVDTADDIKEGAIGVSDDKTLGEGAKITASDANGGYATTFVLTLGSSTTVVKGTKIQIAIDKAEDSNGNKNIAVVDFTLPTIAAVQ